MDYEKEVRNCTESADHFRKNFCRKCSRPKTDCNNGCVYGTALKALLFRKVSVNELWSEST